MVVSKLGEIDVKVEMKSFKNFEYCIEGVIFLKTMKMRKRL
jgi:hypothetical protein